MFDFVFQWVQNLVFFLVIVSAALEVLPGKNYQKYVRFYTGIVFILLMASPILKLFGAQSLFESSLNKNEYEQMLREMERQEQYFEAGEFTDFLFDVEQEIAGEEETEVPRTGETEIKVEEIRIGSKDEDISETTDRE